MNSTTNPTADFILELPPDAYRSVDFCAIEDEKLFSKAWIHVAAGHELPRTGDLKPIELAGLPLLLVRQPDGRIEGFHNVCRHRGARLVDSPCNAGDMIRCPYHRWGYELDGTLQSTPGWDPADASAPANFVRGEFGLEPVRTEIWCDQIFVCLSTDGPSFTTHIAPLANRWSHADLALLEYGGSMHYAVHANWKLVIENYLDTGHLPFVHPQLGGMASARNFSVIDEANRLIGVQYPKGATDKHKGNEGFQSFPDFSDEQRQCQDIAWWFPNTLIEFVADHVMFMRVERIAPAITHEQFSFYYIGDDASAPAKAAGRQAVMHAWDEVNRQDLDILTRLQHAMHSPAARNLPGAASWDTALVRFREVIAKVLELAQG